MKRTVYHITYNGNTVVKNAHNSSIREIEKIMRGIAKDEQTTYHLTGSEVVERSSFEILKATRTWTSEGGKEIKFEVTKIS